MHFNQRKPLILLVGIHDNNTVSLAGHLLRAYAERFPISSRFEIATVEFSIFNDTPERMLQEIRGFHADIIGFSVYVWNHNEILEIAPMLDSTIILDGPQLSGIEETILAENPSIDLIVTGEGEVTFVELLEYYGGKRPLASIDGLHTREINTPARAVLEDLNQRLSPYPRILAEHPTHHLDLLRKLYGIPHGMRILHVGVFEKNGSSG